MLPGTTTRLIDELTDPMKGTAWAEFDARYWPMLVSFALRLGFSAHDATEVATERGLSVDAVDLTKSRLVKRMREIGRERIGEHDEGE